MRRVRHIAGFEERVIEALHYAKDVKGLSGGQIADRMGIRRTHLYSNCNWSTWKLAKFCEATGVNPSWLLGLGGDMV